MTSDGGPRAGSGARGGSSGRGGGSGAAGHAAVTGGTGGSSGGTGGSAGHSGDAGRGGTNPAEAGKGGTTSGGSGGGAGTHTAGTGAMMNGGEGGEPEGGAPNSDGELAALNQTIASYCTAAATCCAQNGEPTMLDACPTMYAMYQDAVPAIKSGAVTIDADALARCQAAYGSGPDQCNLNAIIAACSGVYLGHQQEDEPCGSGYSCDRSHGPTTCLITDTANPNPVGVCKKIPHAALGEPCATTCRDSDEDCSTSTYTSPDYTTVADCFESDGLYCAYEGSVYSCKSIVPLGQTCDSYDSCGSKATCDTTCKALSDRGEPCGNGCLHQYQCGTSGNCEDPTWGTSSACMGYAPGP